jgi:tRNA-modifying protein YgfZ
MQDATKSLFNLSTRLNVPAGPLGMIRAQGADAVKFLQGQLTQDVALLGLDTARLGAWCNAKGRMLASFVLFKNASDDIVLLCHPSVQAATLKRLQMFVMRAQCKLTDATADFEVLGLTGDAIKSVAACAAKPWAIDRNSTENSPEIVLQLPAGWHGGAEVPRALRIRALAHGHAGAAPAKDTAASVATGLEPAVMADAAVGANANANANVNTNLNSHAPAEADSQADLQALAAWAYLEASTGIAPITAPVAEAYVPQMLNYESVGGVNFKKGCYPGQEVVARSQFRGTLKRRAYVVRCDAPMAAGQEVFDAADSEQPCGSVAFAAAVPGALSTGSGQWLGIVSMQTSAAGSTLTLGAQGPALQLQALPYALLDDI